MTEELCRAKFEEWFKRNMFLAGRCFVTENNKRRMWRAYQAAWNARAEMEKSDD